MYLAEANRVLDNVAASESLPLLELTHKSELPSIISNQKIPDAIGLKSIPIDQKSPETIGLIEKPVPIDQKSPNVNKEHTRHHYSVATAIRKQQKLEYK